MSNKYLYLLLISCYTLLTSGQNKTLLFVGTYTEGKVDKGIYIFEFDTSKGKLKLTGSGENLINPSFLTIAPNGQYLYACMESKLPQKGSVAAFKIDSIKGEISFINKQSSEGENPVYLTVDPSNQFIIIANYNAGNIAVFKTNVDGSIQPAAQIFNFSGSSIIKSRQEQSHIHAAVFSPTYDYIYCTDLGADKIRTFKFDSTQANPLQPIENLDIKTSLGSGPRHMTFHPNQHFAYCIEELNGMITAYSYSNGKLEAIQSIFSYSKKQVDYGGADIHISPDGKFLYASNRLNNENTISIFSINDKNWQLTLVGHQKTFGDHPRNFIIDPSGKFLIVANLATNNLVVFKRNLKTGLLTKTKQEIKIPRPSCLLMRTYHF